MLADPGLLDRVIANVVQNALRYSPAGTPGAAGGQHPRRVIELRVIDRGPGIPEAEREQAFAPFQRRDDLSTSGSAGVGLGLAIARGFTEAMGGIADMEDTPGGGLTVVIVAPAAGPAGDVPRCRGLTCDDDRMRVTTGAAGRGRPGDAAGAGDEPDRPRLST